MAEPALKLLAAAKGRPSAPLQGFFPLDLGVSPDCPPWPCGLSLCLRFAPRKSALASPEWPEAKHQVRKAPPVPWAFLKPLTKARRGFPAADIAGIGQLTRVEANPKMRLRERGKAMRTTKSLVLLAVAGIVSAWLAVGPTTAADRGSPNFGDPLPGLSRVDIALFEAGKANFNEVDDVAEGLGPIFNARSCGECHSFPTTGGGSAINEVRFGQYSHGVFNDLASQGGSLLQLFAIEPKCQELLPASANRVGFRQTTPLFGAGLIEAILDGHIEANANVQRAMHPAQAGRVSYVTSPSDGAIHVGRFGWKAQQALLLDFSADAYLNEMGITNDLFPHENAPNGNYKLLAECDRVPDPEDRPDPVTGRRAIDNFTNFMRFLAPPPPGTVNGEVLHGEEVFHRIGCAVCHHPSFTAVSSHHPAINGQTVALFSDLLLHDVGTGDGIPTNEFRSPPLWGLHASAPYLHDGSAATPEQAILRHGGQATSARRGFEGLSEVDRKALLAFLNSL